MLIFFAAFQATRDWSDLIALLAMGTLGIFMKRFGWSRPALLIGYFLAPRLEPKIYQASQVYGWSFFERPIVIVLLILTVASIYMAWRFSPNAGKTYEEDGPNGAQRKSPQLTFALVMAGFAVFALMSSFQYHVMGKIFPMVVSIVTLVLAVPLILTMVRSVKPAAVLHDNELMGRTERSEYYFLGWVIVMLGFVALVGFPFGCALFIYAFITWHADHHHLRNAILGISGVAFLGIMSHFLSLRYPSGLLQLYVEMPWWLGG
jgi:putative tricarboxylic transport membrane protein